MYAECVRSYRSGSAPPTSMVSSFDLVCRSSTTWKPNLELHAWLSQSWSKALGEHECWGCERTLTPDQCCGQGCSNLHETGWTLPGASRTCWDFPFIANEVDRCGWKGRCCNRSSVVRQNHQFERSCSFCAGNNSEYRTKINVENALSSTWYFVLRTWKIFSTLQAVSK